MVTKAAEDRYESASQGALIWKGFKAHKMALVGLSILGVLYGCAIFADFIAPYDARQRFDSYPYASPTRIHIIGKDGGLRAPFIYVTRQELNLKTYKYEYVEDLNQPLSIRFFVKATPYKALGLFVVDRKLFGVDGNPLFIMGSDALGRDLFSRAIYASRISLSIGFTGVLMSFIIGCLLGAISGYFGGALDEIIQRAIDLLNSIPQIPLWMALSAAVPPKWSIIQTYFAITVILGFVGWTNVARVVRGKLLALREYDFAVAARAAGASEMRIMLRHLLPAFSSYLIVSMTLAIPNMILGETALSFLGLGMQAPAVSWGTLLQDAQQLSVIASYPWHLWPCAFVVVTVLMFNFVGDGLRDAADPYSR